LTTVVTNPDRPHATFGGVDHESRPAPTEIDFIAVQRSDEFVLLRRRLRRFVFPMSALFFGWYLCYVLLAAYAHGLMSRRISGEITVGLVLGVLQFVTTILIMIGYLRYARARIDPQVAAVRSSIGVMPR
jgi:uncharacterized membrane protein (DUF485 family)